MILPPLRGHNPVKAQLAAAWDRQRLGQAYLFAGPEGVGKRTAALALSRALLCEHPPGRELAGCGHCPGCIQVNAGTHPQFHVATTPADKQELPVEVARTFLAALYATPARVPRTVGLILDADELNLASANALLKTLEEPPPGATLILRSLDPASLLPTIRSRCQVLTFQPLADADVSAVLTDQGITDAAEIARAVQLSAGRPGAALALASGSLNTFRDSLIRHLAEARPDPVALATKWIAVCEEAGKESADQRTCASASLRIAMEVFRQALRVQTSPDSDSGSVRDPIRAIATRGGAEGLVDWLEACVDADYLIARRVQLALVLEKLAGQLAITSAET